MVDVLPDDHVETAALREYGKGAYCAVVGAYKGATMNYLLDHGATFVAGVEPQTWAYDVAVASLSERYGRREWALDNVALVPWETTPDSTVTLFHPGTDGASVMPRPDTDSVLVRAMNVIEWLGEESYDFMVVNCEGAEYMLLPWLAMRTGVLLVQYHGPPMPISQLERVCESIKVESVGKGWYLYTDVT
jgi:hypothetical protein